MVESTGLENRRCESIRGFESHSLRQLHIISYLRKYPSGRRGSPAKGVGRQKRREGSNPSFRAKSRNRGTTTVPRFFLYSCRFAGTRYSVTHNAILVVVCNFRLKITDEITDELQLAEECYTPRYIPCKVLTSAALSISIPPSQAIRLRRGYALSFLKKVPLL